MHVTHRYSPKNRRKAKSQKVAKTEKAGLAHKLSRKDQMAIDSIDIKLPSDAKATIITNGYASKIRALVFQVFASVISCMVYDQLKTLLIPLKFFIEQLFGI